MNDFPLEDLKPVIKSHDKLGNSLRKCQDILEDELYEGAVPECVEQYYKELDTFLSKAVSQVNYIKNKLDTLKEESKG